MHNRRDRGLDTNQIAAMLKVSVTIELAIPCRSEDTHLLGEESARRKNRYAELVGWDKTTREMAVVDNQVEALEVSKYFAGVQGDLVLDGIREILRNATGFDAKEQLKRQPAWHINDILAEWNDTPVDSGCQAAVSLGRHNDQNVALKLYNGDVRASEYTRQQFIATMNLWES